MKRQYVAANGQNIDLGNNYINFKLLINNKKFHIRDAIVTADQPKNQIILGASDLERFGAILNEANGEMTLGNKNRTMIKRYSWTEIKSNKMKTNLNSIKGHVKTISSVDQNESVHKIDGDTSATIGDTCYMGMAFNHSYNDDVPDPSETCLGCPKCTTTENKILDDHYMHIDDSNHALEIMCHKIRQKEHNTFSHKEVTITPEGERRYPWAAKRLREINEKYKCNFAASIGDMGPEFTAKFEVQGETSKRLVGQQPFIGMKKAAIKKQLISLLANGVLQMVDKAGITPKYFISLMPRLKKDDDGVEYCPMVALRIVNDCTIINQLASYGGTSVDNIQDCVNWAAQTSSNGLNAKTDISQCYHAIRISKDAWPMMCIEIPDVGNACLTRLPQGLSFSAQYTVATLRQITWKFNDNIRRYIDDVFLSLNNNNSEKEFCELWENFMKTLKRYNLRIKGSKTFLLNFDFNFLGYRISQGAIQANPHLVNKILEIKWEDLKTIKSVMGVNGMVRYLAKFMKRSTHTMSALTQAIRNKKPAEKMVWTPELINKFNLIKEALKELSETYPFDPNLETVITVDTSKIATGGLIYQIKDGKPRLVAFFSRSRKDIERKFQFSSCNFEAIGACAILKSHEPWLMEANKSITLLTDAMSLVKLWRKFKMNLCPSDDIKLNNCLMEMRRYPKLNIVHASNKNASMLHPDFVSRMGYDMKSTSDTYCAPREGVAACKICELAHIPIENTELINNKFGEISVVLAENIPLGGDLAKVFQLTNEARVPIARLKQRNISLKDLLNNKNIISALQKTDRVYRDMIDCLINNRPNFPRKHARAETIRVNREPILDGGALSITKWLDGQKIRVYPIPKESAYIIIHAVHMSVGHRSPTQLCKQIATRFEFENMKSLVNNYISKCIPCTLLRSEAKFKKQTVKPVKVADSFFKQILCDEIHRQRFGKTEKFLLAIEALSQFLVAIPMPTNPKSEDFVSALLLIKTFLAPHVLDTPEIEVRCDAAPWHKSEQVKNMLKKLNIRVHIHESSSLSKNIIPELDGKIAQFSVEMAHYMQTTNMAADVCAQLAVQKCNTALNSKGYTPSQLFTGRSPSSTKMFDIDVQQYIKDIQKTRQQKRQSMEKKNFMKKNAKKLNLVPFKNEKLNDPLLNIKNDILNMKIGDLVKLNTPLDKNAQNPNLFVVTGINFKNENIRAKRSGTETTNNPERIIAFERIARVIKVDVKGKVNFVGQHCKEIQEFGKIFELKNLPDPNYIITDEDLDDALDIQNSMKIMVPKIILGMKKKEEVLIDDNITLEQSSTFQAVPSAVIDTSKLLEDSSWFKSAEEAVNEKKNEEKMEKKMTLEMFEDEDEDYEIVTEETLSKSLLALSNLNEATTVSMNDSEVQTWDSNESYNKEVYEETRFLNDMDLLNSTIEEKKREEDDQLVPVEPPDERPIRSRKPVEKFQISWSKRK